MLSETYVAKRFPHKTAKRTGAVLRPSTIHGFISQMQHAFQPGRAKDLNVRYHFRFTGREPATCTVIIENSRLRVEAGLSDNCDIHITASSQAWLRLLRKEASIGWLLLTLQVRLWGDPRLLAAFGRCFP